MDEHGMDPSVTFADLEPLLDTHVYDPLPEGMVASGWLKLPEIEPEWLQMPQVEPEWLQLPEIDPEWLHTITPAEPIHQQTQEQDHSWEHDR
ncbi:MAG: hypothetical protein J2P37_25520 [Ktedonobacteraceae bacterium]|nr:hypothetical protein [Ktedonobacteraceae bacterium]